MLLMKEQGHSQVSNLLLGIFVGRDEVDGLEMAEIDVPAENIYVQ